VTESQPITIACVPEPYPAVTNAIVQLQKDVWGAESSNVLPSRHLVAAARTGGELLVAYTEEALVGFATCSPGLDRGAVFLHVDLLGVHPDHRNAGVGERLMREVVRIAALRGIARIRWTFDPLDGASANLSLAKLGARGIRFLRNFYAIEREGQPLERTDRLLAELTVARDGSTVRENLRPPEVVLEPGANLPYPLPVRLALAVPTNRAAVRATDPVEELRVSESLAAQLEHLFALEFRVNGFERGEERHRLLLERTTSIECPPIELDVLMDGAEEHLQAVARAYILHSRLPADSPWKEELFWAFMRLGDLQSRAPELAWRVALAAFELVRGDVMPTCYLAAGPFENLIEYHGARFIERIEALARRDLDFARLLDSVWMSEAPDDIQRRVAAVRHETVH
jgi:predicted GNAT superfamily acetyltransferase